MTIRKRIRWMFLGDFEEHSIREMWRGAAAYAATRPGVEIDPWSTYPGRDSQPTLAELQEADGLLLPEIDLFLVSRKAAHLNRPHVFYLLSDERWRVPAVLFDNLAVGRMAAEHLIQRGYRHLAVFGLPDTPWSQTREEGFRAAAAAQGLTVQSCEVLPSGLQVLRPPQLRKQLQALDEVLKTLPTPCGIFATCDVGACYFIKAAREQGFRIPEQFGVIGVDDDPLASDAAGLAISTVQVPFREAGWCAAALLDDWLRHGKRPPNPPPLLPVRVIVRTSTNQFMVADPLLRRAQELIEERRAEGLAVAEVAAVLRTTPVTLGQRFRQHLKLTPSEYILQRRLEYAKELLRAGELSVGQISEACHFHDCSYFCKIFKRATGTSPSALQPQR